MANFVFLPLEDLCLAFLVPHTVGVSPFCDWKSRYRWTVILLTETSKVSVLFFMPLKTVAILNTVFFGMSFVKMIPEVLLQSCSEYSSVAVRLKDLERSPIGGLPRDHSF